MQNKSNVKVSALNDAAANAAVEAEISRIQTLKPEEVRALWRDTFKKDVPKALTRDLLVRTLCWHLQEKAFGGHSSAMLKLLASYAIPHSQERRPVSVLCFKGSSGWRQG